jgi:drug/metabolite transporter (DMT)-like permease
MTLSLPLLLLLILGNMWGLSFSLSKLAVTGGIHPIAYLWMQATGSALFLCFVCWRSGIPIPRTRRHLTLYAVSGLTGMVLPNFTIVTSALHLPAGILSTLVTMVPILTFTLAVTLGVERFRWTALAGLALGLVGMLLLVLPETSLPDPAKAPWVLVGLLTPVFYATSTVLAAKLRPEGTPSLAAAFGMVAAGSLTSLPMVLWLDVFHPLFASGFTVPDLAMAGQIAVTCVAYVMYFEILQRSGPIFFSQVSYIVNIAGLFWGYLIFAEIPSPWLWGTVGLVFAGVYLVNRRSG